jgi:hypothetical protein
VSRHARQQHDAKRFTPSAPPSYDEHLQMILPISDGHCGQNDHRERHRDRPEEQLAAMTGEVEFSRRMT